ncbi:uncharacterized protein LOC112589408 [Harpegnathos saltator]|uniref:uncharacterized protein LOC112589408 n=1 Tax=Harpegnathos saltator TaxID=610380 RepID=UPI000DBEE318|nr:uncharacterized protein LOC112589408 [Harpegnathos saltator]
MQTTPSGGGGRSWGEARLRAETAVASVVGTIEGLGLRVAPQKTESVFFHDDSRGAPPETRFLVDDVRIRVGPTIKYLGRTLDGRWDFGQHFRDLAPRVRNAALAVTSLQRNLGGPGWRARRLYTMAVLSIALYGAPIWAPQLSACRESQRRLRQALRPMMIRMTRSYSTVSYMAATTLIGFPPVELIAKERGILYWRVKEAPLGGGLRARDVRTLKSQAVARTHAMCADILSDPRGYRPDTAEAARLCLPEWAGRRGCGLSFHLVQILTGHGCFGKYLHRIGKEPTTRCHHCPALMDTTLHTLAECTA